MNQKQGPNEISAAIAESQFTLASMYAKGDGFPKDQQKADYWLSVAEKTASGDTYAVRTSEVSQ